MPTLKTWFAASRPFSFTAAAVPAIVGTLLASEDAFSWWRALLVLLGSVLFLAGTNFVNDYYDHAKGADGPESLGMAGFIQRGILTPKQVLTAGLLCFGAGGTIGLVLCATGSWQAKWGGCWDAPRRHFVPRTTWRTRFLRATTTTRRRPSCATAWSTRDASGTASGSGRSSVSSIRCSPSASGTRRSG